MRRAPRAGSMKAAHPEQDAKSVLSVIHRSQQSAAAADRRLCAGSRMARRRRDPFLPSFLRLDQTPSGARPRDADASRRHSRRRAADRRARAAFGERASAHADDPRLSLIDPSRDSRRTQSSRLSLSLVDAGDRARQDRREQGPDPHSPAMVRQAQIDPRHPQGGDDQ